MGNRWSEPNTEEIWIEISRRVEDARVDGADGRGDWFRASGQVPICICRLARQIFDQLSAALRGYWEEENGEVKQAIEYAMDASNRIIEKIGKLKRRGNSNTEIKSLKRI